MNVKDTLKGWSSKNWFKILRGLGKSFLVLAVVATFIFFSIMVYLLVLDYYYYDESETVLTIGLEERL